LIPLWSGIFSKATLRVRLMHVSDLRIALFSGNYNYVRDGANQSLNRLVEYLLRQGAKVRVYSPTTDTPAFAPQGDLVSVPSTAIPFGRGEYRLAWHLPFKTKRDIVEFAPNVFHISIPALLGSSALRFSRKIGVPSVASMHTRFETYPRYYNLSWLERPLEALIRRFYLGCDAVVAPNQTSVEIMRTQGMGDNIGIWARGIDPSIFNPAQRSFEWRRALGIGDEEVVVGYLGRLVLEKGLDVFAETVRLLKARDVKHRVLIIGAGPADDWLKARLPDAIFAGFQSGQDLGRATASLDIMLNPSTTEAFGNVMLEGLASGVPVVAARAAGGETLIVDGKTGRLIAPGDVSAFADAVAAYCVDPKLRRAHGAAAHEASSIYDWDQVNHAMIDTYMRVIAARAK
jgi:phosphatidylinositol alpha 1,6-mannosyltransferase